MIFETIIDKVRESNTYGLKTIENIMFLNHVAEVIVELEQLLQDMGE